MQTPQEHIPVHTCPSVSNFSIARTPTRRAQRNGSVGYSTNSRATPSSPNIADAITVLSGGRVVGCLDPRGIDIEVAFFEMVRAVAEDSP